MPPFFFFIMSCETALKKIIENNVIVSFVFSARKSIRKVLSHVEQNVVTLSSFFKPLKNRLTPNLVPAKLSTTPTSDSSIAVKYKNNFVI